MGFLPRMRWFISTGNLKIEAFNAHVRQKPIKNRPHVRNYKQDEGRVIV